MGAPTEDKALAEHMRRIDGYMRGWALLRIPRSPSPLRDELAQFLKEKLTAAVNTWIAYVGRAFAIPKEQWPQLESDMRAAMGRWISHIADPQDCETYVYLRRHARQGFIAKFPASRFLSSQMKVFQLMSDELASAYRDDPDKLAALQALLTQEFQERILHIADFFVEAREEELREQEGIYRRSIDNAPAAIFRVSVEDGQVLDANFVARTMLGYSAEEISQFKVWDLHPESERERARQLWEKTKASGHSNDDTLHLQTRDGNLIPVFINSGVVAAGHRRFIQRIHVDISEQKKLESQLIQSEKMAAIGQLAAGIAHEIRNPLGIIMNALYDLGEIVDASNPAVAEDLKIAKEEINRAQSIINNLLEFSRESRAELESVDINDLVRRTIQLMNKYLRNNDVAVTVDLEDLSPIRANQNALRQIFLNLITNSVQAMPHGGELRIATRRNDKGAVVMEFADTGEGIAPEHLKDIFNPFFTTKAPGAGTGLGLSVVHSIVERYGGRIQVKSKVNVGTTIVIELPCEEARPDTRGHAVIHGG